VSSAEEVVRLTNGDWAPYYSKKLKHYGVASRIVKEAFALEGVRVEYGFFPWKRGFKMAEAGKWDGAVAWNKTPEREKFFYFSDVLWESGWVFFHLKSYPFDWNSLDDLKNVKIGGTLEYIYTVEFLAAEQEGRLKVDRVTTDEQNFRKLLSGRIRIFPQLTDVGFYQLQQLFKPETVKLFTHHPKPLGTHHDYVLLSKKIERNKRLITLFNKGLKKLKDSGKHKQFFDESRRGEYSK